jgi:hypothetical protein
MMAAPVPAAEAAGRHREPSEDQKRTDESSNHGNDPQSPGVVGQDGSRRDTRDSKAGEMPGDFREAEGCKKYAGCSRSFLADDATGGADGTWFDKSQRAPQTNGHEFV